ncbi:class I SAM-dependent methyltransferase [Gemmatimonadota bacterium DH-20]|uniref:Class I SAM-dependent methyltransferase n=2 Tax=Gaopeijia maritima TaxID=3119007 RepID=A0ABU9EC60_9BACT
MPIVARTAFGCSPSGSAGPDSSRLRHSDPVAADPRGVVLRPRPGAVRSSAPAPACLLRSHNEPVRSRPPRILRSRVRARRPVQPAMATLLEDYPPEGPVLDVGCGSGDLAIHLAESGVRAIGVDFVEEAISQAEEKRGALPATVAELLEFRVADALRPSAFGHALGAVVDSGFLHLFGPEECDAYAEDLARAIRPGGRLYLHEFAIDFEIPNVPREVTGAEVRARFTPERGWRILEVRSGEFLSQVAPMPTPAILACVERVVR